jgi:ribosomal protein S18 acetylase RimI-like enzyme
MVDLTIKADIFKGEPPATRTTIDGNNPTENNLIVRDFETLDLDNVSSLIKYTFLKYENYLPSQSWRSYVEKSIDIPSCLNNTDLIIAEIEKRLVGFVALCLGSYSMDYSYLESHPADQGWPKKWAVIHLLVVSPAFRCLGIGHTLVEECICRCRESNIRSIGLHSLEFPASACNFYETIGLLRAPEFDYHPGNQHVITAYCLNL